MGLFDKLFKKEEAAAKMATEKDALYAPITGKYIALEEIEDNVFSAGVLGQGCGIVPEDNAVYAPVNGTISTVADTKHAIAIAADDGAEILIHVGLDTVAMNGNGFRPLVKVNQKVACGQKLLEFDIDKIKAAGYPTTTAFIITNSDDYSNIEIETGKSHQKTEKIGKVV